jgi:metal transporter CNNM
MSVMIWIGIAVCLSQSAMFSGLNLAFFSISRLRLEVENRQGNKAAATVLALRSDSNFLLTTILWGNVGINVLLTLLSNQVLFGVGAFMFSTVFITLFGEIMPQAYFSRNALRLAGLLSPVLKIYQIILYPVAKPAAILLDKWLGIDDVQLYKEKQFKEMIALHVSNETSDIDAVEGTGALNFLKLDDLAVAEEGENLDPESIIMLPSQNDELVFPEYACNMNDAFLKKIQLSKKKWVILIDEQEVPHFALDADQFLREVIFTNTPLDPHHFCHRPIIVDDPKTPLDLVISRLKVYPERTEDDVIDEDIILLWGSQKKVITGADILGRLLRGIAKLYDMKNT